MRNKNIQIRQLQQLNEMKDYGKQIYTDKIRDIPSDEYLYIENLQFIKSICIGFDPYSRVCMSFLKKNDKDY